MKTLVLVIVLVVAAALAAPGAASPLPVSEDEWSQRFYDDVDAKLARLVTNERSTNSAAAVVGRGTAFSRVLLASRRLYNGKSVSNRFCAMNSDNECQWRDYVALILTIIIPMIVLAAICLVCCPLLLCFRACNCCGGRKPRPGLCCGRGADDKLYSWAFIRGLKIAAVLALVAAIISFSFAYDGNTKASKGMAAIIDALLNAGRTVVSRVDEAGRVLEGIRYTNGTVSESLRNAASSGRTILDNATKVRATVVYYEGLRRIFVNLSLLVPFVLLFCTTLCGLFNFRKFCAHLLLAQLIMLLLVVVWVSTALHSLLALVISDLCKEVARYLSGQSSVSVINELLACESGGSVASGFQGLADAASSGIRQASDAACLRYSVVCPPGSSPQLNNCPSVCNATTLNSFRTATWTPSANTNNQPLSVSDCATGCTIGSSEQVTSVNSLYDADSVNAYEQTLTRDLLPLLSCDFLFTLLMDINRAMCSQLSKGLTRCSQSSIAFAVFLMVGIQIAWLGQKRYLPKSESKDVLGSTQQSEKDSYATQFGVPVAPVVMPAAPPGPVYVEPPAVAAAPAGKDAFDQGFYNEPPPDFDSNDVQLMPLPPPTQPPPPSQPPPPAQPPPAEFSASRPPPDIASTSSDV